ncbi:unnamed protein product [Cyprideis torosa]|uniref:Uncharacterized protein n=1 Tax=Cyprideis torosa TaxID=163714 RepID=A0A7R8WEN1_9CRUS|nr:unnamed protein product [Cyprideis torosa]CAG0889704.1 unnamed protein product [Cyprideis torosa]
MVWLQDGKIAMLRRMGASRANSDDGSGAENSNSSTLEGEDEENGEATAEEGGLRWKQKAFIVAGNDLQTTYVLDYFQSSSRKVYSIVHLQALALDDVIQVSLDACSGGLCVAPPPHPLICASTLTRLKSRFPFLHLLPYPHAVDPETEERNPDDLPPPESSLKALAVNVAADILAEGLTGLKRILFNPDDVLETLDSLDDTIVP